MMMKRHTDGMDIKLSQHLIAMGWTPHFQTQLTAIGSADLILARVVGVRKNNFRIGNGEREWLATVAGRLMHAPDGLYPVTGDWVLMRNAVIYEVFKRKSTLFLD